MLRGSHVRSCQEWPLTKYGVLHDHDVGPPTQPRASWHDGIIVSHLVYTAWPIIPTGGGTGDCTFIHGWSLESWLLDSPQDSLGTTKQAIGHSVRAAKDDPFGVRGTGFNSPITPIIRYAPIIPSGNWQGENPPGL